MREKRVAAIAERGGDFAAGRLLWRHWIHPQVSHQHPCAQLVSWMWLAAVLEEWTTQVLVVAVCLAELGRIPDSLGRLECGT